MERVGEESVFFVINDPLRDLTFWSRERGRERKREREREREGKREGV